MEFPSIRNLATLFSQLPLFSSPQASSSSSSSAAAIQPFADTPSCPIDSPTSCQSDSEPSCCFVYPGGQLLQTQFWDTNPTVGPSDSWTLHGLWPDLCDGTYDQFCTSAPQYHNITSIISASNNTLLLADMEKYWLPNRGTLEHFWQHEWNKHGTCINTLSPSCYGSNYSPGQEVVDFFARAVELFKGLDTYKALEAAGIEPSYRKKYTYAEIEDALTSVTGSAVVLGCSRGGVLDQAWYSFHVKGNLQGGEFVATPPAGKGGRGSCPERGIRYLPNFCWVWYE
ncbi:ribonuclease T2 [Mollisia scopiformis]|uniref:ribonuclease T2 n=1 Tax=Mollisia scopiformis TaxID=149040 RepID=A0A194XGS7_MOLSC|nr:ribonuclease T2 [Mollisia scopiformis]KUJ19334.1 ribonuclease T2 [Mollisia scopiformis]